MRGLDNFSVLGQRMTAIRSPLDNDALASGVRTEEWSVRTQIGFDALGRANEILPPLAVSSNETTFQGRFITYLPSALDKSYAGQTTVSKSYDPTDLEPYGFNHRITYDALYRVVAETDITNQTATTEWDPNKDLVLSATDKTGLKTTTLYSDEDRPVHNYGPAPAAWFGNDRRPLASYASKVPHSESSYDDGIAGPSVAWHDYAKQAGNTSGSLFGAPKLHTTGLVTSTPGSLSYDFVSPPITASPVASVPGVQGIGFSATGKLRLPNGTYTVDADTTDGIRVWVDDKLVVDSWIDSPARSLTGTGFTISDAAPKRFRMDAYRKTGSSGALTVRIQQQGGFAATTNWAS